MPDAEDSSSRAKEFEHSLLSWRVAALEGRTDRMEALLVGISGKMDELKTSLATADGVRRFRASAATAILASMTAVGTVSAAIEVFLRYFAGKP